MNTRWRLYTTTTYAYKSDTFFFFMNFKNNLTESNDANQPEILLIITGTDHIAPVYNVHINCWLCSGSCIEWPARGVHCSYEMSYGETEGQAFHWASSGTTLQNLACFSGSCLIRPTLDCTIFSLMELRWETAPTWETGWWSHFQEGRYRWGSESMPPYPPGPSWHWKTHFFPVGF